MRAQLDRIASLATLPHVGIGIIAQSAQITAWHIHGFAILADRPGGAVVRVGMLTTGLSISDPDAVSQYRQAYGLPRESAVCGDNARQLIGGLLAELQEPDGA